MQPVPLFLRFTEKASWQGPWNGRSSVYTILKSRDPGIQYERATEPVLTVSIVDPKYLAASHQSG
jgi:hypothetical protein